MKYIILGLYSLISTSAFASENGYALKMDLSLNGAHLSPPRMTVIAGKTGTFIQKTGSTETFIDVIATEGAVQDHKGILLKFVVGTIEKNGNRTVLYTPELLATENKTATFTTAGKNRANSLSLSVTPQRKTL
jgi:Flp pilus assembly secretin CpaC